MVSTRDLSRFDPVDVELKNPPMAALLAWLWPGAGHWYQGRYAKAMLFMFCILVTYFWGLAMGDGHVVYASLRQNDRRYHYLAQVHVGLPAMPAMVQSMLAKRGGPLLLGSDFMAPPAALNPQNLSEQIHDEKAKWHEKLGFYFELGTLFTMVAGLLNLLAVFDAYAGPMFTLPESVALPVESETDKKKKAAGSGLAGTLDFCGVILGIIAAMSLRYHWEIDSRWTSYLFAIVGGAIGFGLSKLVHQAVMTILPREPGEDVK